MRRSFRGNRSSARRVRREADRQFYRNWAVPDVDIVPPGFYLIHDWAKLPAGVFDSVSGDIEPEGDTLVSVTDWSLQPIVQISGTATQSSTNPAWIRWGLVTWMGVDESFTETAEMPRLSTSDIAMDWVYRSHYFYYPIVSNTLPSSAFNPGFHEARFSRASRKMKENVGLLFVLEAYNPYDQDLEVGIRVELMLQLKTARMVPRTY